jgi:hypothetical protein
MLWVRIPPELFTSRPRGAARSARHPVKVEIRGSNTLGDAFHYTTRYAIRQSGVDQRCLPDVIVGARNLRGLWVRLPSASLDSFASAEHWRAQVAVTHPPPGFGGSTSSRRTDDRHSIWPVGLAVQDAGPSSRRGGFESRTGQCRWAGAQPAFIRLVGPVRYRDLHLQKSEVTDTVCRCFGSTRPW